MSTQKPASATPSSATSRRRLHAPFRYLPIVIVAGRHKWLAAHGPALRRPRLEPDGPAPIGKDSPGLLRRQLRPHDAVLRRARPGRDPPRTRQGQAATTVKNAIRVKHYYNLILDFYGKLAKLILAARPQHGRDRLDYQIRPQVYCCGYDWRQDNACSGAAPRRGGRGGAARDGRAQGDHRRPLHGRPRRPLLLPDPGRRVQGPRADPGRQPHARRPRGLHAVEARRHRPLREGLEGRHPRGQHEGGDLRGHAGGGERAHRGERARGRVCARRGRRSSATSTRRSAWAPASTSRKDTTYFVRQVPALYQLLPNALYCRDNKNWVVFDPLATGHPPIVAHDRLPHAARRDARAWRGARSTCR